MNDETSKRRSKDRVFTDLFSDVNYVYELYRELHPEDTDATVEDISIQTIHSVLVNTLCNDLGFCVGNRLLFLTEAQSVWNHNITVRLFLYLADTYRRYIHDTGQDVHNTARIKLPKPELYVIYSGKTAVPEQVSFAEDFFGGDSPVDIKVKILNTETANTLSGQYIGFCRVFDGQRKIYSTGIECARETIRICIEKGYLSVYLREHEKEVITMLIELFDEEYAREQYDKAEAKKNYEEGKAEGRAEGINIGRAEAIEEANAEANRKYAERVDIISGNLRRMGFSEEQIRDAASHVNEQHRKKNNRDLML